MLPQDDSSAPPAQAVAASSLDVQSPSNSEGSPHAEQQVDRAAVLAAVGQVRECLAAARNLEHLVSSISVGPKVLLQVLPDVAQLLARFPDAVKGLLHSLEPRMMLTSEQRDELSRIAALELAELGATFRRLEGERLQARQRLELERQLRLAVPLIVSAVAHCELLVEAVTAAALCSSLRDLLSVVSERRSDRPWRRVPIAGDLDGVMCLVPPRTALLALSAYASHGADAADFGSSPTLLFSQRGPEDGLVVEVSWTENQPTPHAASLPIFFPHSVTPWVVGAALRVHGGDWTKSCLLLPGPGPGQAT